MKDAKQMATAICTSPLVKTAMYGQDPNWGRIIAACGRSESDFDPNLLDLYISNEEYSVQLVKSGQPVVADTQKLASILVTFKQLTLNNVGKDGYHNYGGL